MGKTYDSQHLMCSYLIKNLNRETKRTRAKNMDNSKIWNNDYLAGEKI